MGLFDFLKKKEFEEIKLLKGQLEKYAPVIEIDKEIKLKNTQLAKENLELKELGNKYENSLETYKKLRKEVGLYESKLDLIEFGVYEPVYDFEHSDDYRAEQKRIIQLQKEMIKDETATIFATSWNIEGSEAKGRAMTKKNIKLVLRAFNGESNTQIAKVKWNNVNQMQERIKKSLVSIIRHYVKLPLPMRSSRKLSGFQPLASAKLKASF
jgi:hypothetical protein